MKINDNGIVRDMTPEEEAEIREFEKQYANQPESPEPSMQEQIDELKAENAELKAMIQKLSEV